MSYLENVFRPRMEKDGADLNERVLNQRRNNFLNYAQKSRYKIEFPYNGSNVLGVLTPNRQDQKKASGFLKTSYDNKIPIGSIIHCALDGTDWLVIYLEANISAPYNQYFTLLINGSITWTAANTKTPPYTSQCYLSGPMDALIKDHFASSREHSSYFTDEKGVSVLLPYNSYLDKQSYVTINRNGKNEFFTITGIDSTTEEGLAYLSLEARPERDSTVIDEPSGPWLKNGE